MQTVGERLRRARERKAWTRLDLATRAGLAQRTILLIEHGRSSPRIPTARRLCDALAIDPGWLLFGEEGNEDEREH